MSDPICRVQNPYPKNVVKFVHNLPHEEMSYEKFKKFMEQSKYGADKFFRTYYQLACQLGLYYIDESNVYHPRFRKDISEEEALDYLIFWFSKYYVPNPYTRGFTQIKNPILVEETLYNYIKKNGNSKHILSICKEIFREDIGNPDIFINAVNSFSKKLRISNQKIEIKRTVEEHMESRNNRDDKKAFFENFDRDLFKAGVKHILSHDQTIFYGVPGCGKSNKIKSILDEAERGGKISDKDEQVVCVVFHPEYTNADFIGQIVPKRDKDGHIDYSFEAGPFAKILRRAYLNPEKPYYLIVEEVNRGNAAAIFGDMFQLLDRFGADESEETNSNIYGEGWSAYSVNNADINWYIRNGADKSESGEQNAAVEVISSTTENPYSEIKVGGIAISANTGLRLPPNLSILGTMNTSDQNVFTLDNAFQRRWTPVLIENDFPGEGDETWSESVRAQRDAKIEGTDVSWNTFRTEINKIIAQEAVSTGLSSMEDKRLGCWFVKNIGGEISKELFANKVLKYLWDDAFKFSRPKVFGSYTTFEEVRKDFVGSKAFSVFNIKQDGINDGIPADGQSQDERQES